jgi:hypothetical protein
MHNKGWRSEVIASGRNEQFAARKEKECDSITVLILFK